MFAILLMSTTATLGYLCALAGFLVIVASVAFVIKGKANLNETGAPNTIEFAGKKATFTTAISLFVIGSLMIALPFWCFQQQDARDQTEKSHLLELASQQPAQAKLSGKIGGPGSRNLRLLLVVKPDYDQTYSGDIAWTVPLLFNRTSYSIIYIDGDNIVGQQPFFVNGAKPGAPDQSVSLPPFGIQSEGLPTGIPQGITAKLEVSNAELKRLNIH
jgi:hypothetical protein